MSKMRLVPADEIHLSADGCWRAKAGQGGWAFLVRYGREERIGFGGVANTNSGAMESTAILEGLRCLDR
jgi:ribonuclease HI